MLSCKGKFSTHFSWKGSKCTEKNTTTQKLLISQILWGLHFHRDMKYFSDTIKCMNLFGNFDCVTIWYLYNSPLSEILVSSGQLIKVEWAQFYLLNLNTHVELDYEYLPFYSNMSVTFFVKIFFRIPLNGIR